MARHGDGIYQRGKTWWLDFRHQGQRHVALLGKGINRTVARELAAVKRAAILKGEAGIGGPKRKDLPFTEAADKFLEWAEANKRRMEYEHYRLYPEMPDWELMGFYPMSKRRTVADNWYMLDFATRKRLMGGHARVGRKFAGRVSQLITGSTGLDKWEWGVTLMAHQVDALKDIVYEMRFDEVTARFGEFGPFYVNLRLSPAALWEHLHL